MNPTRIFFKKWFLHIESIPYIKLMREDYTQEEFQDFKYWLTYIDLS